MVGKKQLGQILLEAGCIDEYQLKSALGYQKQWGGRLGKALVDNRFITEDALVEALQKQTGIPVAKLQEIEISEKLKNLIPVELAERHHMIPVKIEEGASKAGETIVLAMSDPTNLNAVDEVQFHTGKKVRGVLATEGSISKAIRRCYYGETAAKSQGEIEEDFEFDPESVQFAGKEYDAEDIEELEEEQASEVSEKQESASPRPQPIDAGAENGSKAGDEIGLNEMDLEDPLAELEVLAKEFDLGTSKPAGSETGSKAGGAPSSRKPAAVDLEELSEVELEFEPAVDALSEVEALEESPGENLEEKLEGKLEPGASPAPSGVREEWVEQLQQLLERLESEQPDGEPPQVLRASHLIATVIRLLLRKEVFSESELLEELRHR